MTKKYIQKLSEVKQFKNFAKQLKNTANFFLRFRERKPELIFHSPLVALAKASRKHPVGDKSQIKLTEIESNIIQGLSIYKDVVSYPLTPGKEMDYAGGLINNQTFTLIDEARHYNWNGIFSQEMPALKREDLLITDIPEIQQTVLFGGILFNNFGHFLLESLGRLWAYEFVKEIDPYILFYAEMGQARYLEKKFYTPGLVRFCNTS